MICFVTAVLFERSTFQCARAALGLFIAVNLIAAAAWGLPLSPVAKTVPIAITGQAMPDGNGTFAIDFQQNPAVNDSGASAFFAFAAGTAGGEADNVGVFRGDGNVLVQLARRGQVVPGGNGTFSGFLEPRLNEAGAAAFAGMLAGTAGGNGDNQAFYLYSGNTLTQVARTGGPAPNGLGSFTNFFIFGGSPAVDAPAFNNAGQVAFWAQLAGGTATEAIFRRSGANLVPIAYQGQPLPSGNGVMATFGQSPILNDSGAVAFTANLANTNDDRGIFVGSSGTLLEIVRRNADAPGGGQYSSFGSTALAMNDGGVVAFRASVTGGSTSNNQGIFRTDGSVSVRIAGRAQAAPDGNGTFNTFPNTVSLGLNNVGQVSFQAALMNTAGGGSDNDGIFRGDGNSLVQVAREGQLVPGGNGRFSTFEPIAALNDAGQVAFLANLIGTSGGANDNRGIYLYDDTAGLIAVARKGDSLFGSTISNLGLAPVAFGPLDDERSGLNRSGITRIAFQFSLSDDRRGVAVWSQVPEPGGLVLTGVAVVGLGLLVGRPRSGFGRR